MKTVCVPKQKNRGKSKFKSEHIREGLRKAKYGSEKRFKKRSEYLGSIITAENHREFERKQAELFINNYKGDEDWQKVEFMALEYAKQQSNRENKHYKAYLKGKSSYTYKGNTFPVLTKAFVEGSQSVKSIIDERKRERVRGSAHSSGVYEDSGERDG